MYLCEQNTYTAISQCSTIIFNFMKQKRNEKISQFESYGIVLNFITQKFHNTLLMIDILLHLTSQEFHQDIFLCMCVCVCILVLCSNLFHTHCPSHVPSIFTISHFLFLIMDVALLFLCLTSRHLPPLSYFSPPCEILVGYQYYIGRTPRFKRNYRKHLILYKNRNLRFF